MEMLKILIKAMRPLKWTHNVVIFLGLIFSGELFNIIAISRLAVAFIIFCMLSGAIYIVADLKSIEEQKRRGGKLFPSLGGISKARIEFVLLILLLGALVAAFLLGTPFGLISGVFLFLGLAYYFFLKNVIILDFLTPSLSLSLCAIAGGVVVGKPLSPWLLIFVFLLGLSLTITQKRYGVSLEEETLPSYSPSFLDSILQVIIPCLIVIYILYTLISEDVVTLFRTKDLIFTIPFVIYGIFRYLYLVQREGDREELEKILLTDKFLLINLGLWLLLTCAITHI